MTEESRRPASHIKEKTEYSDVVVDEPRVVPEQSMDVYLVDTSGTPPETLRHALRLLYLNIKSYASFPIHITQ
jgi:hypothetical protein